MNDIQRFVVLSFDEVKIQSGLVFDKHSGKIIGFVDVGDNDINFATFSSTDNIATHVLSFYVRNFYGNIKFHFAYFGTDGILSYQLFPLFWKAVSILEINCKLKVIASVSDGATANRKFIKMHNLIDQNLNSDLTYRAVNLYAPDRYIWFFSDYCHLLKTARNCLHHSGFGDSFSRLMYNNGKYLIWQHIKDYII